MNPSGAVENEFFFENSDRVAANLVLSLLCENKVVMKSTCNLAKLIRLIGQMTIKVVLTDSLKTAIGFAKVKTKIRC